MFVQSRFLYVFLAVTLFSAVVGAQSAPTSGVEPQQGLPPDFPQGPPPDFPASPVKSNVQPSGVVTIDGEQQISGQKNYTSQTEDVSAIYVIDSGQIVLIDPAISTTGSASPGVDTGSTGINAAVLAKRGGVARIIGGSIKTSGNKANGASVTDAGSLVELTDVNIETSGNSARAVMSSDGGSLTLLRVHATTTGRGSGAIAGDYGTGPILLTDSVVNSSAYGVYVTGFVNVTNTKIAAMRPGVVVEGENAIVIRNSEIASRFFAGVEFFDDYHRPATNGEKTHASLASVGGSITVENGSVFDVSNTRAVISVDHTELKSGSGVLISANAASKSPSGRTHGKTGFNGGDVIFTATRENIAGDLLADSISSISAALIGDSTLSGTIRNTSLRLDQSSKWIVTGDSSLQHLDDSAARHGNALKNIVGNGHKVTYDASLKENAWLQGKKFSLENGGTLEPAAQTLPH